MGAVGGSLELDHLVGGEEFDQRVDGPAVVDDGPAAAAEDDGNGDAGQVDGRVFASDVEELGHEGGAVGPTLAARAFGEPTPGFVAHHPAEEGRGEGGGVF